ncbi:MAG: DNA translocase FtsK [Alphaproteobacteria bacterium]|nr:DNA translocase FtsK [Alphaproteobacteria bacterium]
MGQRNIAIGGRGSAFLLEDPEGRSLLGFLRLVRAWTMRTLRVFAWRLTGLALIVACLAGVLAFLSFNPKDPSFNQAADGPIANLMGSGGAAFADLALQWLGLAAVIALAPLGAWGVRLAARLRERHWRIRLISFPVAVLALAGALAFLPVPAFWPIVPGLGGLLGDLLAAGLGSILEGPWGIALSIFFALALLIIGLGFLALACGARLVHADILLDGFDSTRRLLARLPLPTISWRTFLNRPWGSRDRDADAETREEEVDDDEEAGDDEEEEDDEADEPRGRKRVRIARPERPRQGRRAAREPQRALPLDDDEDFELPALDLLAKPRQTVEAPRESDEALQQNARLLESVLSDFGVRGQITHVRPGPVVTLYELEPAAGIKASRVISLADDIARSMSAVSARVAVVPGRNVIGIELPNRRRETVFLRELLAAPEYDGGSGNLTLALGKDISGAPVMADLARMPHLLIAGTTGSGKSVAINTMILSLLYRMPPSECRLILIDPKMLELSVYDGIPHLLSPVVTEPKKAIAALKWTVREMEDRYRKMSKLGVRNIAGYNERVARAAERGETLTRKVQTGFDRETGEPIYETEELDLSPIPMIVVVVDEMADLMIVAGKDIEALVQRLAQMARAAGIHMITATQRPSVDVITGTIKANFPTRISFQVTSKIDSRTILGEQGAEQLLGQGDMLYMAGGGRIRRVHGPFVSDNEVEQVVRHLKKQGTPEYLEAVTAEPDELTPDLGGGEEGDDLYRQALEIVIRDRKATTSYIQRRLQIGYNRAARIIERMEEEGVLSSPNHTGKRDILIDED